MITQEVFTEPNEIGVQEENTVVCLESSDTRSICLTFPPSKKLHDRRTFVVGEVSIRDFMDAGKNISKEIVGDKLFQLEKKHDRFKGSSTYLNHLAAYYRMSGDLMKEQEYLEKINDNERSDYFFQKIISNRIFQSKRDEAKELILSKNDDPNGNSSLSLAYLSIGEKDFESAERYIIQALEINPLNYKARTVFGSLQLIKGDIDEAIRQYKLTTEDQPYSSSLYLNIAIAYLCKNDIKKAKKYARQSVALNPLNKDAVVLYTDLLIDENENKEVTSKVTVQNEEAISILEYFVHYEPKSLVALERLARAYYVNKDYTEALKYLKLQNAFQENSYVLNNIALTYRAAGNRNRAYQYFNRALQLNSGNENFEIILNYTKLLLSNGEYKKIVDVTSAFLSEYDRSAISSNDWLAKIYLDQLFAKSELRYESFDVSLVETFMDSPTLTEKTKYDCLIFLLFFFGTYQRKKEKLLKYLDLAFEVYNSKKEIAKSSEEMLLNNLVYSCLEIGCMNRAKKLLGKIGSYVHKKPFHTATVGLWNIKKGKLSKGENLYRESIALVNSPSLKNRLKQKMNLELGKAYFEKGDIQKALVHFKEAIKHKEVLYQHFYDEARQYLEQTKALLTSKSK